MSGALVFTSGALVFVAATQGTPSDHLALVAREACIPRYHETVTTGETVHSKLPCSEHYTNSRVKYNPTQSFCERGLVVCAGSLASVTGLRFGSHLGPYGGAFREHRLMDAISALLLCLASACWYLPERSLYSRLAPLIFFDCCPGIPPNYLVLMASGAYICGSTGLYIFA